jgi:hypothetical protein
MTDILLVQPPIRDFYLTAKRTIPYGLAGIAAVLIRDGFSVEIIDALASSRSRDIELPREMHYLREFYTHPDHSPFALFHHFKHFGYSFEHIGQTARRSNAQLVGISSLFTPYWSEALKTAEVIRAHLPDCKIVMGGHHPTVLPEEVIQSAVVDFILRGDGEVSMPLLAKALINGKTIENIPGIVRRTPEGEITVDKPARMANPDIYPLPAVELIHRRYYRRGKKGSAVVVASRGCPMKCSYCSMRSSADQPYIRRRVASVIAEVERAVDQYDAGFIDFEDENLSLDRRWFLDLLGAIQARFGKNGLELRAMNGLFPPALDEEIICAMAGSGFKTLNLSLGSTSADQLRRFQRPDVRRAFDAALELAPKYGLQAVGYIIVGGPDQRAEDSVRDLLYLAARRVLAGVSTYYPSPASPDYERCRSLGVLPNSYALMRSSALPISHTTTRQESSTLLRLGRVLNFIKSILDHGASIPHARPHSQQQKIDISDRVRSGRQLLAWFLNDGKIRGIRPDGAVYEHNVSTRLTRMFLDGLKKIEIKGTL